MKKFQDVTFALIGKSSILALILFFSTSVDILAVNNLSVSGVTGTNTNANDTYIYQGIHNSHYYWKGSTHGWYIYWDNGYSEWELGATFDDADNSAAFWGQPSANDGIPYALPFPTGPVWDSGFPDFTYMTMEEVPPLPVELTSFTAFSMDNNVQLTWQTATEVNNYGFEIQRSAVRGQRSEEGWEKAGFVEGHGNSNSPKEYSFIDQEYDQDQEIIRYRLKQIDFDGKFEYSGVVEVEVNNLPTEFSLEQNYPNPFNPTTSIEYSVPSSEYVNLKIYDILGNEVSELVNEQKESGNYKVNFDASKLSSGLYIYKIQAGSFSQVRKMMLLK